MEQTIRINRYDYNLTIMITMLITSALWLWFIYGMNIPSRSYTISLPKSNTIKSYSKSDTVTESKLQKEILAAQAEKENIETENMTDDVSDTIDLNSVKTEGQEIIEELLSKKNVWSNYKAKQLVDAYKFANTSHPVTYSTMEMLLPVISEEDAQPVDYVSIDELKENISFQMDLNETTGISKQDFVTLMSTVKADRTGFFAENSEEIYDLCQQYEINEVFFCGLIAAESGWEIKENHRTKNNYISMMGKNGMIRYGSRSEGLEEAAKLLHYNYLTEGGKYYHGNTIEGVQHSFCPNSETWEGLVYGCMKLIVC